jgi:RNA polymerase sigma-70 factor (ECF subfamily)
VENTTVSRLSMVRPHRRPHAEPAEETADEAGLHAAFVSYGGELFGFARRSLGDGGLAEEAVQETFMRAWRSRHRFDSSLGSLRNWLFTIERRVIIDLAHKRASSSSVELEHDPAVSDDQAEHAMLGWQVEEALRRLRPEHRAVVQDIYFKNLPGRDVAARLGVPEGTVRSRLFYALRSLRLIMEEMGWEQ